METPRGRLGVRAGLRRDAFEVGTAERLVREAADAHASREADRVPRDDAAIAELRVMVAEVARRARAYLEAGRG